MNHFDEAMKLAEKQGKHELYLKILIENKKDLEKALNYIQYNVPLEEKEKYIIEFGQDFMKYFPNQLIDLIKMLVRVHSLAQIIKGKERDYILSPEEKELFLKLNFDVDELDNLTTITFKKPDEFFRLFLNNN